MTARFVLVVLGLTAFSGCIERPVRSSGAAAKPTSSARAAALYPCDDGQFLDDQRRLEAGTIHADQLVDICGAVTAVLPERRTRSGEHGYFYLEMPSGHPIEILSNLDAMAQAPAGDPPATWPWIAARDYVYVQGRYYYDDPESQGVDWTEDDTDRSWPYVGYVVVCDPAGTHCTQYR